MISILLLCAALAPDPLRTSLGEDDPRPDVRIGFAYRCHGVNPALEFPF